MFAWSVMRRLDSGSPDTGGFPPVGLDKDGVHGLVKTTARFPA